MTTVITRLYASMEQAQAVVADLTARKFPSSAVSVITGAHAADAMSKAKVKPASIAAYAEHLAKGAALVVVRAPFGTAVRAVSAVDKHDSIDVGDRSSTRFVESITPPPATLWERNLPTLLDKTEGFFPSLSSQKHWGGPVQKLIDRQIFPWPAIQNKAWGGPVQQLTDWRPSRPKSA